MWPSVYLMPGNLGPHMHHLREAEALHLQFRHPSTADFISGQTDEWRELCAWLASTSPLSFQAGHLRSYCLWVWRLLSLLRSLQISVWALLKWASGADRLKPERLWFVFMAQVAWWLEDIKWITYENGII